MIVPQNYCMRFQQTMLLGGVAYSLVVAVLLFNHFIALVVLVVLHPSSTAHLKQIATDNSIHAHACNLIVEVPLFNVFLFRKTLQLREVFPK